MSADLAELTGELRRLLAELTGNPLALTAPLDTALLRNGIGLDSLGGTMLLTEIERRYGVDVAAEDLNLDALASIGSLAAYLARRGASGGRPPGPARRGAAGGRPPGPAPSLEDGRR